MRQGNQPADVGITRSGHRQQWNRANCAVHLPDLQIHAQDSLQSSSPALLGELQADAEIAGIGQARIWIAQSRPGYQLRRRARAESW